jgi:Cof subfamily protein (haloacid dehalogenase superfamily)
MYKAVFIDIDGTLLKNDGTMSEATISTIQRLKARNILVILVSARPLSGISPIVKRIGLTNYPVASLNGAYIAVNRKVLFHSIIDIATTTLVHEQLQQFKATLIYYGRVQWFSELRNISTDNEQKITSIPITIQPFTHTLQYWQGKNTGPNKIMVIAKGAVIKEIQHNLKQQFIDHLNICTSKPTFLEVVNTEASKLNAVKLLIDHYNIKREEIITIGDNFNDKEMIAFAGTGIAMGNAPGEVKAVAKYITDTNNKDGVSKALKKFMDL